MVNTEESKYLFEIFLPLLDQGGLKFPEEYFSELRDTLFKKFDGVTIHQRSPSTGMWSNPDKGYEEDKLIIYEVMASDREDAFWRNLREELRGKFKQKKLLIRCSKILLI